VIHSVAPVIKAPESCAKQSVQDFAELHTEFAAGHETHKVSDDPSKAGVAAICKRLQCFVLFLAPAGVAKISKQRF